MSNQYTKIESIGSRQRRSFYISIQKSVLPESLREKDNKLYQSITENILRNLRGYTLTNQANFENIIKLATENEAKKLAKEVNDILNNKNCDLFSL